MHSPTQTDFGLLKRILRYIKGTLHLGLHIKKDRGLVLSAYCDSDWAGCKETRRSTTGFCTLLGPNLISWSAKRQPTVSRSSTEAEYRALCSTAQETTWISFLLRDLGVAQPCSTVLRCDNLSAVYLSANPALHNRSKHFDTDFHYIREQVALGLIETIHIPSAQQVADIFTKSLPRSSFLELRTKLGVGSPPPTSSLRGNVSVNRGVALTVSSSAQDTSVTTLKPNRQKMQRLDCHPKTSKSQSSTVMTMHLHNRFDTLLAVGEGQ